MAFIVVLAFGSDTSCRSRTSASRAFLPPASKRGVSSDISLLRASMRAVSTSTSETAPRPVCAEMGAAAVACRSPQASAQARWQRVAHAARCAKEPTTTRARAPASRRAGWHRRAWAVEELKGGPRGRRSASTLRAACPSPGRAASATLEARLRRLRSAEKMFRYAGELGRNFRIAFSLADEMGESATKALRICKAPLLAEAQGAHPLGFARRRSPRRRAAVRRGGARRVNGANRGASRKAERATHSLESADVRAAPTCILRPPRAKVARAPHRLRWASPRVEIVLHAHGLGRADRRAGEKPLRCKTQAPLQGRRPRFARQPRRGRRRVAQAQRGRRTRCEPWPRPSSRARTQTQSDLPRFCPRSRGPMASVTPCARSTPSHSHSKPLGNIDNSFRKWLPPCLAHRGFVHCVGSCPRPLPPPPRPPLPSHSGDSLSHLATETTTT